MFYVFQWDHASSILKYAMSTSDIMTSLVCSNLLCGRHDSLTVETQLRKLLHWEDLQFNFIWRATVALLLWIRVWSVISPNTSMPFHESDVGGVSKFVLPSSTAETFASYCKTYDKDSMGSWCILIIYLYIFFLINIIILS